MIDRIITSVVASLVTALVIFAALNSMNFFKDSLQKTEIQKLAAEVVDNDVVRGALLREMENSGKFIGLKGAPGVEGPKGEIGEQGPKWQVDYQVYSLVTSSSNPQSRAADLGAREFCALNQVVHPHANQACGCQVIETSGNWRFELTVDPSVSGGCRCSALCVN